MEESSLLSTTLSHLLADYSRHKYWGGETRKVCKSGLTWWFFDLAGPWWKFKGEIPVSLWWILTALFWVAFWNGSISPNGWLLAACYEVSLSLQNGPTGQDSSPSYTNTRCIEDTHVLLPGHILGMQASAKAAAPHYHTIQTASELFSWQE